MLISGVALALIRGVVRGRLGHLACDRRRHEGRSAGGSEAPARRCHQRDGRNAPRTPEADYAARYVDDTLKTLKPGQRASAKGTWATDRFVAKGIAGERPGKGQTEVTPCDHVAVFDIHTGRKLWQKKLPGCGASSMTDNVTMTRGAVLAI